MFSLFFNSLTKKFLKLIDKSTSFFLMMCEYFKQFEPFSETLIFAILDYDSINKNNFKKSFKKINKMPSTFNYLFLEV